MPNELTMLPDADPREAAQAVAALADDAQVQAIMNRLNPADAARLVASAPGISAQTRLVWSMAKTQRAVVMDHLAPITVAALIQNQERRNRKLLGDLSLEQFAEIFKFCGPKQRYYWLSLANSFSDVASNLLVALLPPEEVAEALLTVTEFRRRLYRLRNWMPGGLDGGPPVKDERLLAVLMRLAEYSPDRYTDVIEAAVLAHEQATAFAEISAEIEDEPVVLPHVPEIPPLVPRRDGGAGLAGEEPELNVFLPVRIPLSTDALMRAAAGKLAPERRVALEREMEKAFRGEVLADGGSLAMPDLERAAARLQAYLRLGLQGVSEEPDSIAEVLETVELSDIVHRGTVALEQLRQIALRLRAFRPALDARQRDLLDALIRPSAVIEAETGAPALLVRAIDRRKRPEAIPIAGIQEQLAEASVWVAVARALGLRSLTEKLAEAPNGSAAVLAALAVSLVSYGQWDPRALESVALRRFRDAHFDRAAGRWLPGTEEQVGDAVAAWARGASIEPVMRPRVEAAVLAALGKLQEFFAASKSVGWDRFAPGKRQRKRRGQPILPEGELITAEEAEENEWFEEGGD